MVSFKDIFHCMIIAYFAYLFIVCSIQTTGLEINCYQIRLHPVTKSALEGEISWVRLLSSALFIFIFIRSYTKWYFFHLWFLNISQ